jgi:hypothetical protein
VLGAWAYPHHASLGTCPVSAAISTLLSQLIEWHPLEHPDSLGLLLPQPFLHDQEGVFRFRRRRGPLPSLGILAALGLLFL